MWPLAFAGGTALVGWYAPPTRRAQMIPRATKPVLSCALHLVEADPERRKCLGEIFMMPLSGGYAAFAVVR
jgi:hypothetical protein